MTARLPAALDDLRGLRAARWTRESTAGQEDAGGPDEQRELQDIVLERYGLVDTGIVWQVAHSGFRQVGQEESTLGSTRQWAEMVAAAGVTYDVLVVGYVSRFARRLRTIVNARHDLHAAGASILFADEDVLSSSEDQWEQWAREAVEAEAYSRKLGRRIRNGYASKRRRLGIPGGNRAPLGTVRSGKTITVDETAIALVRRAYDLAGAGWTDRDVAAATGLRLKHVAELLTNPFYVGQLTDGSASVLGELVGPELWKRVQALRSRYSRRHRGRVVNARRYALSGILACAACGRRLVGHNGRMRHLEACPAFVAAAPRRARAFSHAGDRRIRGASYKAELYDEAVGHALARAAAGGALIAETVGLATRLEPVRGDELATIRIERERETAALRYARDRDLAALEAAMARLDAAAISAGERVVAEPTAAMAREWSEDLASLWVDTSAAGRRAIAEVLFERIDVLGVTDYSIVPSLAARAHGWDVAFGEPFRCSIGLSGRGGRASTAGIDIRIRVAPREPLRAARSA